MTYEERMAEIEEKLKVNAGLSVGERFLWHDNEVRFLLSRLKIAREGLEKVVVNKAMSDDDFHDALVRSIHISSDTLKRMEEE